MGVELYEGISVGRVCTLDHHRHRTRAYAHIGDGMRVRMVRIDAANQIPTDDLELKYASG